MKAKLVGPGTCTGKNLRLCFSVFEELSWQKGAEPAGGASLLGQIRRGPCSWSMLLSCVSFAVPGAIHLWNHEVLADYVAGVALLLVSLTSSLCDAFAVDSAEYDHPPYKRVAAALGESPEAIGEQVRRASAEPAILAMDRWNMLTRILDR